MSDDLLVSLRRYTPRTGKDPIENFFTEAFSWIIENNESLAKLIIERILGEEIEITSEIKCSTQVNFAGVFPDMLIEFNDMVIVSEHKVWAQLHKNQIKNYREYVENNYSKFKILLITATEAQHTSEYSDINLCWSDFYEVIKEWLAKTGEMENQVVVSSFLRLLKDEGVGPTEPVEYSSIHFYNIAKKLPIDIDAFLNLLENKYGERLNTVITEQSYKECRWGRYGFSFLNKWNPGLFIGFLLDESDHKVKPVDGVKSPDFSLIVDFDSKYHKKYPNNKSYQQFKKDLNKIIKKTKYKWNLYDVSEHGKGQNKWHPLHVRVPMRDIFIGTESVDEQVDRFFKYIGDIVPPVLGLNSLKKMRNDEFK